MAQKQEMFFSRQKGLKIHMDPGEVRFIDGAHKRVEEKFLYFHDTGDGWGRCMTSDPDEIAFLKKRADEVKDVLSLEQHLVASRTYEQQVDDKTRELAEKNELIANLQKKLESAGKRASR